MEIMRSKLYNEYFHHESDDDSMIEARHLLLAFLFVSGDGIYALRMRSNYAEDASVNSLNAKHARLEQ